MTDEAPMPDGRGSHVPHPSRPGASRYARREKPLKLVVVTMTNGQELRIRTIRWEPATSTLLSSAPKSGYLLRVTLHNGRSLLINPRQICTVEEVEE